MLKHSAEYMLKHQAEYMLKHQAEYMLKHQAVTYAEKMLKLSLAFKFDWKISETETGWDFEKLTPTSNHLYT